MKQLIFTLLITFIFNASATAEENIVDFGSAIPTEDQFSRALNPKRIKTRSIRPLSASGKPAKQEPVAVNLSLTFEFDSAVLTDRTKKTLNSLGPALNGSQLDDYAFRIEGHTDALGESRYNDNLSMQRAESVKEYLANNFGVSPERLEVIGKGEKELLDPKHPGSSKNRRVKIVNIGNVKP